jgi:hypothetical protein
MTIAPHGRTAVVKQNLQAIRINESSSASYELLQIVLDNSGAAIATMRISVESSADRWQDPPHAALNLMPEA